jgi:hypothetical protein
LVTTIKTVYVSTCDGGCCVVFGLVAEGRLL